MEKNSNAPTIRSFRDDNLGDVLVLDKADLPTLNYERAVAWLQGLDVSLSQRILKNARKRGELIGSYIGNEVIFSKQELLDWLQSRRGTTSSRAKTENWGPRR
ncbi:MAG: hypothetical protein EKK51_00155 [Mycolicibacterium sp.]|uniref:hypothetical protein n=1 Tax=Mycolicibacterium sp. TaxID=2320850 RepID=UPI000FC3B24B|nr:hypothetical protein [Mycolicibacterium sp.]RUP35005.1 MAG: hypothetical protein EKK51_00155 [Mycolicibacterium sp.]